MAVVVEYWLDRALSPLMGSKYNRALADKSLRYVRNTSIVLEALWISACRVRGRQNGEGVWCL